MINCARHVMTVEVLQSGTQKVNERLFYFQIIAFAGLSNILQLMASRLNYKPTVDTGWYFMYGK